MFEFHQADLSQDREIVRELFSEYLQWMLVKVSDKLGIDIDAEAKLEEDMSAIQIFSPPHGRIVLATAKEELAGIGCLKMEENLVGEVKRMYVRPNFRRRGIGQALLKLLLDEAEAMGCKTIRLESAWFMEEAHTLYHSFGFVEIPPYQGSEVPEEIQHLWIFMEKRLESIS